MDNRLLLLLWLLLLLLLRGSTSKRGEFTPLTKVVRVGSFVEDVLVVLLIWMRHFPRFWSSDDDFLTYFINY